MVGVTAGGTEVSASENVPRPVQESRPRKTSGADAGREKSGKGDQAQRHAADAGGLHDQERAEDRGAEQGADRREAAGRGHDGQRHRRRVLLEQAHGQRGEAAADRDQRRLRPEHRAQAQGREGGEDDAGELAVAGGPPPVLKPNAGEWPPLPGR